MSKELPITEDLDFHYLLSLMPPLKNEPEFQWLPELFSIIGHEKLLILCKLAGGETIRIPTLEELSESIEALQYFYDLEIAHRISKSEIPSKSIDLVSKIMEIYHAEDD